MNLFFQPGINLGFGETTISEEIGENQAGVRALQGNVTSLPKLNFKLIIYELRVHKMPLQCKCSNNLQI